ncbi:hypothetical protein BST91_07960 [Nonlabens tegetincola]|uniref:glycosyltransferase family 2 protein n=1 Tax=Nonlabens tegetincola TaxID=323273 RepID=UPI000A20A018|nr:galactosyltransferase-related protein [Nonlabens tegetincola]ARN71579.1 hypothetical protein BST91_07960 [Nonlabens tegetincola]
MSNTLTIVIPNRSRNLDIIERSINSLHHQLNDQISVFLIDYGSAKAYQKSLSDLIKNYPKIHLELLGTQGQLWNKSRCINYVLKKSSSSHLMVCDMDMIWHPQALQTILNHLDDRVCYYQVGFLDEETTISFSSFESAKSKFISNKEATGISVFPKKVLIEINGFDEFYHGWGAEDTDVHIRCRNAGVEVRFHESEILFKHQWHDKAYRGAIGTMAFHDQLERINHEYCDMNKKHSVIKANTQFSLGIIPEIPSSNPIQISIDNAYKSSRAVQAQLPSLSGIVELSIQPKNVTTSQKLKSLVKSEKDVYLSFQELQNFWIEYIIMQARDKAYAFMVNHDAQTLRLTIAF